MVCLVILLLCAGGVSRRVCSGREQRDLTVADEGSHSAEERRAEQASGTAQLRSERETLRLGPPVQDGLHPGSGHVSNPLEL